MVARTTAQQAATGLFEGLFESAPDGRIVINSDGRIQLVSRQTEILFGYSRAELLGQHVEKLVPQWSRTDDPELRAVHFSDPRTRLMRAGLELTGRRKDGSEFPVDISLSALATDKGTLVSAAVRDVTEWMRAERERQALKQAQSQRLESLGQLAGGVAHDFNNLLAAILNYAGLIQRQPGDVESVQHDIGEIIRAAERGAALTHQLLLFGRREIVKPRVMDLNTVVREMTPLLKSSIGENIELHTVLDPELESIKADPSGIEQVLMNLVVNARSAMPAGGLLKIETSNLKISPKVNERVRETTARHIRLAIGRVFDRRFPRRSDEKRSDEKRSDENGSEGLAWNLPPGRYVKLSVSDSGAGMPPEVVARAFEPFFTTMPKGQGSGLGLATVYGIVTQAGGVVRIYSEPGIGTVVRTYFPATAEAPQPHAAPPSSEALAGHGEKILVVEDDDQVREPTLRVLSAAGYQVMPASNGDEAIEIVAKYEGTIDLLMTDVVMPGMSGPDLGDRLQGLRPGTPVLFTSGYPQDLLERGAIEPGLHLLEKPYTTEQLLGRVRALLDASGGGEGL